MTAILPLAVWQPGTLQPSTPVNDNALRVEILQRGAISITSTPPGSPADGDTYILGAAPTGAWSTFAENDVVLWRSGTWYRFAPFSGWLKQVATEVRRYDGTAWVVVTGGGGGGAVPIQEEGSTVVASPTAINFVGAGATVTDVGGVATVTIPGVGGGGGEDALNGGWFSSAQLLLGGTSVDAVGMNAPLETGLGSGENPSFANAFSALPRRILIGTSAVNSVAGLRGAVQAFARGSSGVGGYVLKMRSAPSTGSVSMPSTARFFIGARASTAAPADDEPSSYTDIIGVGYDASDTELQVMHNDGSGTASKIPLGAGFTKPTALDGACYELTLTCVAGAAGVDYSVVNLSTGASASGTVSTDQPSATTGLNYWAQSSSGGTLNSIRFVSYFIKMRLGLES